MKVGDLVKARYKTGLLGIITKINRVFCGNHKKVSEYTVLWNNGKIGYVYDSYLEAVKKCP